MANDTYTLRIEVDNKGRPVINKLDAQLKKLGITAKNATDKGKKGFGGMWKQMLAGQAAFAVIRKGMRMVSGAFSEIGNELLSFDAEFQNVTTLFDTAAYNAETMKRELLGLAGELGSVTELTKGMYQALSASVEPAKAIGFIEKAAKFSKAALTDMTSSVDILTTIINAYGLEMKDTTQISDVLFQTIKDGKITGQELASSLARVIPSANTLGIELQQVTAAVAVMTKTGIKSHETMTSLNAVMMSLLKPTKQATDEVDRLNRAQKGLNLIWGKEGIKAAGGFQQFLVKVKQAIGDDEKAMARLVPNIRALKAAFTLTGAGAGMFEKELVKMYNTMDNVEIALAKQRKSFNFLWEGIKNKVVAVFIEELLPTLERVKDYINDNRDAIVLWAKQAATDFVTAVETMITIAQKALGVLGDLWDLFRTITFGKWNDEIDKGIAKDNELQVQTQQTMKTMADYQKTLNLTATQMLEFRNAGQAVLDQKLGEAIEKELAKVRDEWIKSGKSLMGFWIEEKKVRKKVTEEFMDSTNKHLEMFKLMEGAHRDLIENSNKSTTATGAMEVALNASALAAENLIAGFTGVTIEIKNTEKALGGGSGDGGGAGGGLKGGIESVKIESIEWIDILISLGNQLKIVSKEARETDDILSQIRAGGDVDLPGAGKPELGLGGISALDPNVIPAGMEAGALSIWDLFGSEKGGKKGSLLDDFKMIEGAMQGVSDLLATIGIDVGDIGEGMIEAAGGATQFVGAFLAGDISGMIAGAAKAVGGLIKAVAGIFGNKWDRDIKKQNEWMNLTDEQSEKLKELAKEVGSVEKATSMMLAEFIDTAEITNENFGEWANRVHDIIGEYNKGLLSMEEMQDSLGSSFSSLIKKAKELGREGSREILNIIRDVRNQGLEVAEITEYVNEELVRGAVGLNTYWNIAIDTQEEFNRAIGYTLAIFNSMVENGMSAIEAMSHVSSSLGKAMELMKKYGFEATAAFDKLLKYQRLVANNKDLLESITALNEVLEALGNTANLTYGDFQAFEQDALSLYNQLIDAGFSQQQALESIAPLLENLWWYSQQYGYSLSGNLQKLLAMADAAGLIDKDRIPAEDKQVMLLEAILKEIGGTVPYGGGDPGAAGSPPAPPDKPGVPDKPGKPGFSTGGELWTDKDMDVKIHKGEYLSVTPDVEMGERPVSASDSPIQIIIENYASNFSVEDFLEQIRMNTGKIKTTLAEELGGK